MIYLDNAATTMIKPPCVAEAVTAALTSLGNASRGAHEGALNTNRLLYRTRGKLADFFGCPKSEQVIFTNNSTEALNIALSEIGRFLLTHEMQVTLVVFDRNTLELSEDVMGGIEQFIDEHATQAILEEEYGEAAEEIRRRAEWRRRQAAMSSARLEPEAAPATPEPAPLPDLSGGDLDDVLGAAGKSFQQRLFELIDQSGMDDVTVYKKANIDRKVFSRIRCKPDYKPTKKTAVAFAVALRLDLPTTRDLLARAELALSPSSHVLLVDANVAWGVGGLEDGAREVVDSVVIVLVDA